VIGLLRVKLAPLFGPFFPETTPEKCETGALPKHKHYANTWLPSDGTRWVAALTTQKAPNVTVEARGMNIDRFIKHSLGPNLDRPINNRNGIAGLFDFDLEFVSKDVPNALTDGAPNGDRRPARTVHLHPCSSNSD
jgi:hypothetical protein